MPGTQPPPTRPTAMPRPQVSPSTDTYRGRFAARLRELREKRGKSVDEFLASLNAAGVTVSKAAVYSWETGARVPSLDDLPTIADVLGVSVRTLMPAE